MKKYFAILLVMGLLSTLSAHAQHSGANWLKDIPDNTPISDINLPGSHDAAAINPKHHSPHSNHYTSMPEQLESGIRLLDLRIKVKGKSPNYSFGTCHGNILGGSLHFNEFQSLASVFDECKAFLAANPSEFIVIMLKIDDWNGKDKDGVYKALDSLLFSAQAKYPIYTTKDNQLPTTGELHGKIYLMNRFSGTHEFGVPVLFPQNASDTVRPQQWLELGEIIMKDDNGKPIDVDHYQRKYPIYIQDQFEKLGRHPENAKFHLVVQTFAKKRKGDGMVVLNYSTARQGFKFLYKVYIQDSILNYFGRMPVVMRPANFGWLMLDYESFTYPSDKYGNMNLLNLIIASNFGYEGYTDKFKVSGKHRQ